MKRTLLLILTLLAVLTSFVSCSGSSGISGGGSSVPAPSSQPIPIEFLDGATDVSVDASFQATFSDTTDMSTVTETTFFIVSTQTTTSLSSPIKAVADEQICNAANRLPATVTTSGFVAILTPTNNLSNSTRYTICIVNVKNLDSSSVANFSATFVTEASSANASVTVTLLDAQGDTIPTSGATIALSPIYILFSQSMNVTSITSAGNISLTCVSNSGSLYPTLTIAQAPTTGGTSDKSFIVTIVDAYTYQLMNCTLVLSSNIRSSTGISIGTTQSFVFTASCAVSDTFTTNSQSCWTVPAAGSNPGTTWGSWAELNANNIAISGDSTLSYAPPMTPATVVLSKDITFNSDGFEISMDISAPLIGVARNQDILSIGLYDDSDSIAASIGFIGRESDMDQHCFAQWQSQTDGTVQAIATEICPISNAFTFLLRVDSTNGMTASYSSSTSASGTLTPDVGAFPTGADVQNKILQYAGQTWKLKFLFTGEVSAPTATINNIRVTGISSTTQY